MNMQGIDRLLTFNSGDFQRYRGIQVLDPIARAVDSVSHL